MLCGPSGRALGQASFLVLVVAVISPAAQPIASQLETVFFQFFFVGVAWAWSSIALAIAHASRSTKFSKADFQVYAAQRFAQPGMTAAEIQAAVSDAIFEGVFIEAAPSAVCAIFLGAGCGFFLWLRGWVGPGPMTFGLIFSMILIVSRGDDSNCRSRSLTWPRSDHLPHHRGPVPLRLLLYRCQ